MMFAALSLALFAGLEPAGPSPAPPTERLRALVLTGESRDHDWRWTSTSLRQLLEESGLFRVEITVWPEAELSLPSRLATYDLLVVDYDGPRWDEASSGNFVAAVRGGTGLLVLHAGAAAFDDWSEYRALTGGAFGAASTHEPPGPLDVTFEAEHAILGGLSKWRVAEDAVVRGSKRPAAGFRTLAAAALPDGTTSAVALAGQADAGRVFLTTLGHVDFDERSRAAWADESFQRLLVRGAQWAATGAVTPLRRVAPNTLTAADRAAGWRLLFDGASLEGWKPLGEGHAADRWRVEGDALRLLPGEGELVSEAAFRDFELELEWRVASGAELAFAYAVGDEEAADAFRYTSAGSAPANAPRGAAGERRGEAVLPEALRVLRPVGEYNHARVVAVGGRVEHWLNGIRILALDMGGAEWAARARAGGWKDDPALAELRKLPLGSVALQRSGADVWFRNVKLRPLLPDAPPAIAGAGAAGPATLDLLAGASLDAWTAEWWAEGADDVWSFAPEGHLECRGFALGYLQTQRAWRDFELAFEYRFHPTTRQGGDGGVLVRMQGAGFYPPCLEVRLTDGDAGAIWSHGDFAYEPDSARTNGRVTAPLSSAERPPGQWNRMRIRLERERLFVVLNDTLVNELAGVAHLAGPLGLKSEGVEIHYRDLRVTPLD